MASFESPEVELNFEAFWETFKKVNSELVLALDPYKARIEELYMVSGSDYAEPDSEAFLWIEGLWEDAQKDNRIDVGEVLSRVDNFEQLKSAYVQDDYAGIPANSNTETAAVYIGDRIREAANCN